MRRCCACVLCVWRWRRGNFRSNQVRGPILRYPSLSRAILPILAHFIHYSHSTILCRPLPPWLFIFFALPRHLLQAARTARSDAPRNCRLLNARLARMRPSGRGRHCRVMRAHVSEMPPGLIDMHSLPHSHRLAAFSCLCANAALYSSAYHLAHYSQTSGSCARKVARRCEASVATGQWRTQALAEVLYICDLIRAYTSTDDFEAGD